MKIRTQTLVAIVPLFLGLMAVDGALIYFSQSKEMMWGLRKELRSVVVSTAEHTASVMAQTPDPQALRARLQPIFERIAEANKLELLRLTTPSGEVLVNTGTRPNRSSALAVLPEAARALEADQEFYSEIVERGDAADDASDLARIGLRRVRDAEGRVIALVQVESDADVYRQEMADTARLIAGGTGIVLGVALLLAWILGGRIGGRIKLLNQRATELVDGRLERWQPVGGVREIDELDGSFQTINSVLNSELGKSRRKLLENEQFRTREDLLETLGETIMKPIGGRFGGREVVARCINPLSGYFMEMAEAGDGTVVVMGRASDPDAVDRSVTASSLLFLLRQTLRSKPVPEALERVRELFPEAEVICLTWEGPAAALRRIDLTRDGRIEEKRLSLDTAHRSCAVHNLEGNGGAVLQRYLDRYASLRPAELVRDLDVVLARRFDGCYVVIRDAVEAADKAA
ncbi:MAG TPA: hypothetical protein VED40_03775 [Azospirillaceae bacterium]|nr:hypothetical protein [Azospirillaceae bacterium]